MKSEFLLLSKSSAIDIHTNTLSVFEIIDELGLRIVDPTQPIAGQIEIQLVCSIARELTDPSGIYEPKLKVLMVPPNENPSEQIIPIRFEAHHRRYRLRINLVMALKEVGIFTIKVLSDKNIEMASKELSIIVEGQS